MEYTIAGGGIAAYAALKAIRDIDPHGPITVISEEEHCFYYRPMTPLIVKGDKERDEILFDADLPEHKVIKDRAVGLDIPGRKILLRDGEPQSFDRLLIATGSSPVIPDIPGINEANVYLLRTLADAEKLQQGAKQAKKAVIIGGGLVGVKKAVTLNNKGVSVTIVEKLDQILLPRLDKEGAGIVAAKLRHEGVSILTGMTVAKIGKGGREVELSTGQKLDTDLICVAVGVKPNIDWLADSGLATHQALVVDERMGCSTEGIFAAGDVVQSRDMVTGKTIVSALWTNAVEMGRVAGINMAGGSIKYPGCLEIMNATEIERIPIISVGEIDPAGNSCEIHRFHRGEAYRKLVFRNDVLTGAIFLGDIERAGIYTSLIKSGRPLGSLKEKVLDGSLNYVDCCMEGRVSRAA